MLAETLVGQAGVPHVFSTATGGAGASVQRDELMLAIAESDLPERELAADAWANTWRAALLQLAATLPDDRPSIVVLDEVPYLAAADPSFEGALQSVWDRQLSRKPALMVLIGSDLSVMEQLGSYGRPSTSARPRWSWARSHPVMSAWLPVSTAPAPSTPGSSPVGCPWCARSGNTASRCGTTSETPCRVPQAERNWLRGLHQVARERRLRRS